MGMQEFTEAVIRIIRSIPAGQVATYGSISFMAGQATGARQVSRILHSMSRKHSLPWYRVINSKGMISLPKGGPYEEQRQRLELEGIEFDLHDRVDLERYLWLGD